MAQNCWRHLQKTHRLEALRGCEQKPVKLRASERLTRKTKRMGLQKWGCRCESRSPRKISAHGEGDQMVREPQKHERPSEGESERKRAGSEDEVPWRWRPRASGAPGRVGCPENPGARRPIPTDRKPSEREALASVCARMRYLFTQVRIDTHTYTGFTSARTLPFPELRKTQPQEKQRQETFLATQLKSSRLAFSEGPGLRTAARDTPPPPPRPAQLACWGRRF